MDGGDTSTTAGNEGQVEENGKWDGFQPKEADTMAAAGSGDEERSYHDE